MRLQGGSARWLQGGGGISLQGGSSLKVQKASNNPQITVGHSINQTPRKKSSSTSISRNSAPAYSTAPAYSGGGVSYSGGGGGGSSAPAAPAYDPKVLAQYDQSIGIVNDALGRLGRQQSIALGNLDKNFEIQKQELIGSKKSGKRNYRTNTTQNKQSHLSSKNTINDQYSSGLRGLMRTLGAYGAVGSDLGVASNAASDVATMQRSGAGQTFAQNQQTLDTNWQDFLGKWGASRDKLFDWRDQTADGIRQQTQQTKQDLLLKKADYEGQKAAAAGGDYAGGAASSINAAKGLSGKIDNLGKINPSYNGKIAAYTAPSLSSYLSPQAATTSIAGNGQMAANPLALLLNMQEEDERLIQEAHHEPFKLSR